MQQTDKYQLNLIETSDTFSPAPLNENAQKLEAALESVRAEAAAGTAAEAQTRANANAAEAQTRAAADTALSQRVTALELKKIVFGTFNVTATGDHINLGFTPAALLIARPHMNGFICFTIQGVPVRRLYNASATDLVLEIIENGFYVKGSLTENYTHCFVAFA